MAVRASHAEPHRAGTAVRLNWLRAVLGANDGAVLAAFAATGALSAALGRAPRGPAIARNVVGGLLAMAVTYGIGSLVGHATG